MACQCDFSHCRSTLDKIYKNISVKISFVLWILKSTLQESEVRSYDIGQQAGQQLQTLPSSRVTGPAQVT